MTKDPRAYDEALTHGYTTARQAFDLRHGRGQLVR